MLWWPWQMLEGPQVMECLGMTHALGLMSCILCLVDLCHDTHSYTDLVGKHTCLGTQLSQRHNPETAKPGLPLQSSCSQ